jgi:hypothetical protein
VKQAICVTAPSGAGGLSISRLKTTQQTLPETQVLVALVGSGLVKLSNLFAFVRTYPDVSSFESFLMRKGSATYLQRLNRHHPRYKRSWER